VRKRGGEGGLVFFVGGGGGGGGGGSRVKTRGACPERVGDIGEGRIFC